MNLPNPGVYIPADMVLSDIGMIAKRVEISYHMKRYPCVPLKIDPVVGMNMDEIQNLFGSEFDEMRAATARALDIPLTMFNIS